MTDTSNQQTAPQYELASIFERTVAFLLDFLLLFSLAFWIFYILVNFAGWMAEEWQTRVWFGGFWAVFILYSALLNSGGRRSLGKFLMGIQVVDKDTRAPLGFARSFVRALGYIVGVFTLFAGFALAVLNKNRRAVEDLMAGSIVISTREKTAAESAVISALGTLFMGLCIFYVYYLFFIAPSMFDRGRVKAAQEQVARIAYLQVQHKELFGNYTSDIVRLGLISGDAVQFQRDIQRYLKRGGFGMGVGKDGFSITAFAKDSAKTEVHFTYTQ